MRSRYRIHEQQAAHFVTSTVVAWLPVFTAAARCDILIESWNYCREHKGLRIHARVILDNHFHAIFSAPEHWRYSSAHEWSPGVEPVLRCDPWR